MKEAMYMNLKTGEVVPVIKKNGEWIEGELSKIGTRKGVVIDKTFNQIITTIDTREKAGYYEFSKDIHKNEYGHYTSVNTFIAKLSFNKKLVKKASEMESTYHETLYHLYYGDDETILES